MSSNIQDLSLHRLIQSFTSDGWIVLILSLSGALTRLTLFEGNVSIIEFTRRILSAVAVGMISWFILDGVDWPQFYKIIIYIVIGLDSPSIIKGVIKVLNIFTDNPGKVFNSLKRGELPESEPVVVTTPPEEHHKPKHHHRKHTKKEKD